LNKPEIRDDSDNMVLLWYFSVFHDIINKPSLYEAFTVTFIEQPSFTLRIPVKINGLTNVTHTLIFKAVSFLT